MVSDPTGFALALMIVLMVTLCVLGICAAWVAGKAFGKTQHGSARTFSMLVQRSGGLQLLTVVTIVMSVLILTIIGKLDGAAAVSVFSGIAGYTLGTRMSTGADARRRPDDQPRTLG